jgi:hypothetical protein
MDAKVRFPGKQVVRASRIVDDNGGYMDLARSDDGLKLWVRRRWKNGSTDVTRFELDRKAFPGGRLQFVDGIVEPEKVQGVSVSRHVYEGGKEARGFTQRLEAWILDLERQKIVRPATGEEYPLVHASREYSAEGASRLQWMVFVPSCPETRSGCVYYGKPIDVCRRYFPRWRPEIGRELWIAPGGCRGQW